MKPLSIIMLVLSVVAAATCSSCSSDIGAGLQGEVGFFKPSTPLDPDAKFGAFISRPVQVTVEK